MNMTTAEPLFHTTVRKRLRRFIWLMAFVFAAMVSLLLLTQVLLQRDSLYLQERLLPHWQAAQLLNTDSQMLSAQAARLPLALTVGELETTRDRVDSQLALLEHDLARVVGFTGEDARSRELATAVSDLVRSVENSMEAARARLTLTDGDHDALAETSTERRALRRKERDLARLLDDQAVKLASYAAGLAADVDRQMQRQRDEHRRKLGLQTLLIVLAGLLVGGLLLAQYRFLDRQLLRRIDGLRRAMAEGAVDERLLEDSGHGDELEAMKAELARLLERLTQQNESLEQLATTDALTGLANRRRLFEQLDQEILRSRRYDKPLSVLAIDIDHFKRINDTWGHSIGDRVLQDAAATLAAASRDTDLVARTGGEEFVLLLPETTLEGAMTVAESLRRRVESTGTKLPDGPLLTSTISLGVATLRPGESAEEIINRADAALYAAKRLGRNRVEAADER